ncbi:hypothetical protein [Streptomyces sp. NBC_01506]|uniref:hypothetical protein n=1 Tax=Streptomyces sp. NBC_01506 TaxID=2903887 RepID=UPI003868CC11
MSAALSVLVGVVGVGDGVALVPVFGVRAVRMAILTVSYFGVAAGRSVGVPGEEAS